MQIATLQGASKLRFTAATVNVVCDGNSLTAGQGASSNANKYPALLANQPPLAGTGIVPVNLGVGGQSERMMNGLDGGSAADVDGAFVDGKTNINIAWEITNSIWLGRTASQTIQDLIDYVQARLAVHPWKFVLVTSLPRFGTTAQNQALVDVDNYIRGNFRAMGAQAVCDLRVPGSPFNFFGDTAAPFQATQSLWSETSNWVHLGDNGYPLIAQMVGRTLQRLPA